MNATSDPIIVCRDVAKEYQLGTLQVPALQGVNLTIQAGEFTSIMGPSGCGKTTLLNLIGAMDIPTSGQILVEGNDLSTMNDQQQSRLRRDRLGFVFQSFNLLPVLSAMENVALPMQIAGAKKRLRNERAEEMLERVGLADRLDHRPDELSGGEKQRVAIARAMMNHPAIILADEPTGNLDSETGWQILDLFQELHREENQTVLMVTHDENIAKVSSRIILLRDGQIIDDRAIRPKQIE
ncbi:MAG: ABC transporter ATP-binding protein [Candidatus Hodarchaeales archaeon]|jgi:putative ABC transport system ATP-binding protein